MTVEIKRVSDGATVTIQDPSEYAWFWWTDGNGGCDCNRAAYFYEAMGAPETNGGDHECGHEAFLVRLDGRWY